MRRLLSGFGFFPGASYPFRAINLFIHQPSLWKYTFIPILVNVIVGLVLYLSLFTFGWYEINLLVEFLRNNWLNFIERLPDWLQFLNLIIVVLTWILRLVLIVMLLLIIGWIMVQFGILLGAPWYGILSEEVEKQRLGRAVNIDVGVTRDLWRAILFELKKLVIIIAVQILLILISFLGPISSIISTILTFVLASTTICLDFFDGPLERRRYKFRRKLKNVLKSFPGSFGFAITCAFLISVPLLNFVSIPICVSGGTLFVCDRILPKLEG